MWIFQINVGSTDSLHVLHFTVSVMWCGMCTVMVLVLALSCPALNSWLGFNPNKSWSCLAKCDIKVDVKSVTLFEQAVASVVGAYQDHNEDKEISINLGNHLDLHL